VGTDGPPGIDGQLQFTFTKTTDNVLITELQDNDYIVVTNTHFGNGVEAVGVNQQETVGFGTQFFDCVYKLAEPPTFLSSTEAIITVNVETQVEGLSFSGDNLGNISWGRISNVARGADRQRFITYDPTYTEDMRNFPTLIRTSSGLRNDGGISKRV